MNITHLQKLKIILFLYFISSIYLELFHQNLYQTIIHPIFWLFILIDLVYYKKHYSIYFLKKRKHLIYIFYLAIVFVLLYFCLGFLIGFSINPYQHTFFKILKNIYIQVIPMIGLEIARCFLLLKQKEKKSFPIVITILFFLLELNYFTLFKNFYNRKLFFEYVCSKVIPLFAAHLLFTYITLQEKYPIVLAFRIIDSLVLLLLPILPSFDWFTSGSLGLIKITVIYLLFKYQFIKKQHVMKLQKKNSFDMIHYAFVLVFVTVLISFMLGIFQYKPIVILSNSMYPTYKRGDIVIFKKLQQKELRHLSKGTIIIYQLGNQFIAHRIVNVLTKNQEVSYITKGDSNHVEDIYSVDPKNIQGIYTFSIPFLGFPSVWLNAYFHEDTMKVKD